MLILTRYNKRNAAHKQLTDCIAKDVAQQLCNATIEYSIVAFFDQDLKHISTRVINSGKSNHVIIDPDRIGSIANKIKAKYVVLLHNHPNYSDPDPSEQDLGTSTYFYARLKAYFNVRVLDHLITCADPKLYFSIKLDQQYDRSFISGKQTCNTPKAISNFTVKKRKLRSKIR